MTLWTIMHNNMFNTIICCTIGTKDYMSILLYDSESTAPNKPKPTKSFTTLFHYTIPRPINEENTGSVHFSIQYTYLKHKL